MAIRPRLLQTSPTNLGTDPPTTEYAFWVGDQVVGRVILTPEQHAEIETEWGGYEQAVSQLLDGKAYNWWYQMKALRDDQFWSLWVGSAHRRALAEYLREARQSGRSMDDLR